MTVAVTRTSVTPTRLRAVDIHRTGHARYERNSERFFVVHLPTLIDAWRDQPERPEYLADPGVFWVVKLMDLGIVVPTLTAVGVGLLRGADWAHKAAYGALGWFAFLGSSVAAMAVVMQVNADPAASTMNTITFGLFALVGLTVAVRLLRPLLARGFKVVNPSATDEGTRAAG